MLRRNHMGYVSHFERGGPTDVLAAHPGPHVSRIGLSKNELQQSSALC